MISIQKEYQERTKIYNKKMIEQSLLAYQHQTLAIQNMDTSEVQSKINEMNSYFDTEWKELDKLQKRIKKVKKRLPLVEFRYSD